MKPFRHFLLGGMWGGYLACVAFFSLAVSVEAGAVTAAVSPSSVTLTQQNAANQARVQQGLSALQSVGMAANEGDAQAEALRQACVQLQAQGSAAMRGLMEENVYDLAVLPDGRLGKKITTKGKTALDGGMATSLRSACAALTGQGNGAGFDTARMGEAMQAMALGMAVDEGMGLLSSSGLPFTGRIEASGNLFADGSGWEILTVQPLWHDSSENYHVLMQASWNHTEEREGYMEGDVLNTGLGLRRLSDDRKKVYGLNVFYDHGLGLNHNRMSVGADVQTSMLGLAANTYIPLSDWRSFSATLEERASSGFDLELQGRLPSFPNWQANMKGYQWSSNRKMELQDTWGYDASLQWQPIKALQWEGGLRDEQEADPEFHVGMRFMYVFGDDLKDMWQSPAHLTDMSARVYDKVRRDNALRVERRSKKAISLSVIESIGANTAQVAQGALALSTGLQFATPAVVEVDAAPGSILRIGLYDGGILTLAAGTQARIEAGLITLLTGSVQFVSGVSNIVVNTPGGTINLLGTDIDVSSNGSDSTVRVRDGVVKFAGSMTGVAVLSAGETAQSVGGSVSSVASNHSTAVTHADTISLKIDRVAGVQSNQKTAPYSNAAPRLIADADVAGEVLVIGVPFNTPVTVAGGVPYLQMRILGNARTATLSGGSGTAELQFSYTLQAPDVGATSVVVQALEANSATLTGNGKPAVTTIADATVTMGSDNTAPTITGISLPANGVYMP